MGYQLVVVRGRSANQALRLGNGITTVGRQADCQLRIGSSQVSRRHCQIYERDGKLIVMDLGSSNGTIVNGKKIEGMLVLKPGDVLTLGKVKLRVEVQGPAPGKPGSKPGDTAVSENLLTLDEDDEEFEIDFDEEAETGGETQTVSVAPPKSEAEAEPGPPPAPAAKPAAPAPAPAAAPAPPKPKAEEVPGLGEDAVADFLLNIDLDEDDKR